MSVKSVVYAANQPSSSALEAQNTERGPTENLWSWPGAGNAGVEDFLQDPRLGLYFFDDFNPAPNFPGGSYTGSAGRYAIFSTANGAFADDAIVGGGLRLQASTTAHQGVTLGSSAGAYQLVDGSGNLQKRLVFECRVKVSTGSFSASTQDTFIGLMDNLPPASQVPITNTGGTLAASTNFIGFHKRGGATNANDWNFVFGASGQTIQYPTNMQALYKTGIGGGTTAPSEGTYYKLGFVFEPAALPAIISSTASSNQTAGNTAAPMLKVYVNGVRTTAFLIKADITAATFPATPMAPVIAFMQQSTTANIYSAVDWIMCAQSLMA
jgi:hypothetical protein